MRPPQVLAVDDEQLNLQVICATLESCDVQVITASSGREALRLLLEEALEVDVVLLDRMMPELDGMEVMRRVKAEPRLKRLPVIMQTAVSVPDRVAEGLRAGAYYYLTKPYAPEALRVIVQSALGDRTRRTPLEQEPSTRALHFLRSASFTIRTLTEASALADLLSLTCPDPMNAWTGLNELLTNAVEHGNLEISYQEKAELKRREGWLLEVDRRAALPRYRDRRVTVDFERLPEALRFTIRDEGGGFPWQQYLDFDPERAFDPNGRGVALARALCFHDLHYEGNGNTAVATIDLGNREHTASARAWSAAEAPV